MAVRTIQGDLFQAAAQTLVNTVNTVGVMGKGIAKEFRQRFPEMYADYVARCKAGSVVLGKPYLYRRQSAPWIINFPTKDHWRSTARLADIRIGLDYLLHHIDEWGVTSIAVPPLGCGLGGLDWAIVGPTLFQYLERLQIPVELFTPLDVSADQMTLEFFTGTDVTDEWEVPSGKPVRAHWLAVLEVLDRINRQPYHPPIGRIGFEKLVYFAKSLGLPLELRFERGSFGPHSRQYKTMLSRLLNNGLLDEERRNAMYVQHVGPVFETATQRAEAITRWEVEIELLVDLFMRIQTTREAELAATAHYASNELRERLQRNPSEMEVFNEVREWKRRRRPSFDDESIAEAVRDMAVLRWLAVEGSAELPVPGDIAAA